MPSSLSYFAWSLGYLRVALLRPLRRSRRRCAFFLVLNRVLNNSPAAIDVATATKLMPRSFWACGFAARHFGPGDDDVLCVGEKVLLLRHHTG